MSEFSNLSKVIIVVPAKKYEEHIQYCTLLKKRKENIPRIQGNSEVIYSEPQAGGCPQNTDTVNYTTVQINNQSLFITHKHS